MHGDELRRWRKAERARLIAQRMALEPATLAAWRERIDAHLRSAFPGLARGVTAFCWPIRNEYDARHFVKTLRDAGALTALPVVVAPRTPLIFREWDPGVTLAEGPLGIPYPPDSRALSPDHILLPMNGWDAQGHRLGYGAGYFDRTLAALATRPLVIGVGYEMARLETVHPQPWDIPVDWIVTERGAVQPRNRR